MITPSFSLTATERVLPKLALDFTTASLDGRITFTRSGGTATRVNASGYIEAVAADTPRFDYDPVTLVCKGLLIEEARTNLLPFSNGFDDVGWTKSNATVTPNSATSPDGTNNGYLFSGDGATAAHFLREYEVLAQTKTASIYAKQNTIRYLQIAWDGYLGYANFDLQTGTVTATSGGATASIENAGNGWYRCSATANTTTATTTRYLLANSGSAGRIPSFATSDSIYVYGAQIEAGAFSTSYIINVDATENTRNADVAVMTGTNFSDWFNASEGSFMSLANSCADRTNATIVSIDSGNTNFINHRFISNLGQFTVRTSATVVVQIGSQSYSGSGPYQFCSSYKVDDFASATNGANFVTDTAGSLPSVSALRFGLYGSNAAILNGHIAKFAYWPMKLTNAEIVAFSKG